MLGTMAYQDYYFKLRSYQSIFVSVFILKVDHKIYV